MAQVRQLHELLAYLGEALTLPRTAPLHGELRAALDETARLARLGPAATVALDVAGHRQDVNALLLRASELARAGTRRRGIDRRGAVLVGADLRGADLAGADLRGALFLTRAQLGAAKGDSRTKLPPSLARPAHWPASRRGG